MVLSPLMCPEDTGNIHHINLSFLKRVAPIPSKNLCLGHGQCIHLTEYKMKTPMVMYFCSSQHTLHGNGEKNQQNNLEDHNLK